MRKKVNILISLFAVISMLFLYNKSYARENSIVLNKALTDDINHTFSYPNLVISNDIRPYSITLTLENGYFKASDDDLNALINTYFDFMGGTNSANAYVGTLNTTTSYRAITFNLKSTVDLDDISVKTQVVSSIQSFLRNMIFYNDTNDDSVFTLTFSELEMKLYTAANPSGLDVIAYQSPGNDKEHYYVKISGVISWEDAYDIAAGLKWNNLQGYLATITSEAEHNFIYNSLGSIEGWIGAASITNAEDITYNRTGISWIPATDKMTKGKGHGADAGNDTNIEKYWYWVAGPEAGQLLFNGYTNFKSLEPNNSSPGEWVAEYGYGAGGVWNDYASDSGSIRGYYIEFGGFPDDNPATVPVTLTNTFKWKDYDYRNVTGIIEEKFNDAGVTGTDEDEDTDIEDLIEEAISESGLSNISYEIKGRSATKSKITYDIEITIGTGTDAEVYQYKYIKILNPDTGVNVSTNIILIIVSLIGLVGIAIFNKKELNNN